MVLPASTPDAPTSPVLLLGSALTPENQVPPQRNQRSWAGFNTDFLTSGSATCQLLVIGKLAPTPGKETISIHCLIACHIPDMGLD